MHAIVPKRLIRLDDQPHGCVRLVSLVESVQYLALSYCWGTSKQRGTTKDNLLARQQKIHLAELPNTLRDAITITNILGFQYLWIDSLCIVQDDEEEWAEQSSKMADIYVGAELVVAATQASDCAEGFLHAREEPLRIVPSDFEHHGLQAVVRRTTTHDLLGGYLLREQPLFGRAWVMQDRELARRIIHFLPDELVWRCRNTMRCECGTSKDANQPLSLVLDLCKTAISKSDDVSDISFGQHWTILVKEYVKLKLTYPGDLLPALSGVAQYLHRHGAGNYIAGMWERGITYQLPWFRLPSAANDDTAQSTVLLSPTFSWVTASGPISWVEMISDIITVRCVCVGSTSTPSTANPYGPTQHATITIRGLLLHCSNFMPYMEHFEFLCWDRTDALRSSDISEFYHPAASTILAARNRREATATRLNSIFALELFAYTGSTVKKNESVALLLQKATGENQYIRIGLALDLASVWFNGKGVETNITIR